MGYIKNKLEVDSKQNLICNMCKTRSGYLENGWCIFCNYLYSNDEKEILLKDKSRGKR